MSTPGIDSQAERDRRAAELLRRLDQDRRIGELLRKFERLSHAGILNYNPSGGAPAEPDDGMVAQVLKGDDPPHIEFRRRYYGAATDRGRELVIEAAQAEWDLLGKPRDWTKLKDAPSVKFEKVIIEDGVGWDAKIFADSKRTTESLVRKIRKEAGLNPDNGMPIAMTADPVDKRSEARSLVAQGMSTRAIAARLSVHQTQVMRWIRDAA